MTWTALSFTFDHLMTFPRSSRRGHIEDSWSHAVVKTEVEELSRTRVRLSVEVSFEELKPSLDKAYKEVARQARIPGFRPGKVPPRVIDMRIGRGAVLTEAVNDALPEFYSKAVEEAEVFTLGQPEVEITQLDDGKELTFTAEVEVRPSSSSPT
jgi:trigger factor